ncbi:MAG TPA: UDP-3-O-(3-hydroxymyristoyl)glucosamine N-acyltransferase [Polyangiaceae bacterium]|nr:UDP-3-O-(3-hydroxymyristoyl)glucosamine N-acyltransferase [Polyangiaceae bacterium]
MRLYGGEIGPSAQARRISRLVTPENAARERDLVVVTSSKRLDVALASPAVILASLDLRDRIEPQRSWLHAHPKWVVACILGALAEPGAPRGVSPDALVEPGAVVDPTASIGAFAVVLSGAIVGRECTIEPRAIVYGGSRLGARVVVGPGAVVGHRGFGWVTGPAGELLRMPQLGGVIVEDDVEIGALATVDAGTLSPTVLRRGVKLDAHVHVAHNVEIGSGTIVAAQAGFAGSARLGERVLVGGQAGVTDHAEVGNGARIAAKSGVIGDVEPGSTVAGFPAVPKARWLRAWASLLGERKRRGA